MSGTTSPKNTVLIADDDLFVRKVIGAALQGVARVVEVADGAKVEEAYRACRPNIVFLDIHLPNLSGMDVISRILAMDPKADVVMLSADSTQDNVLMARQKGIRAFLTKPFDKQRVLDLFYTCPTLIAG